jgi:hypothetical protein
MTIKRYLDALIKCCPMALHQRTCLYVGAHPGKGCSFWDEIRRAGCRMTVVEVYEKNVRDLECEMMDGETIIHADIRDWIPPEKYDLVMWWHGPEHTTQDEAEMVIIKLWSVTAGWLVCGAPWGNMPQDEAYGNPAEKHLWDVEPEFFRDLGMETQTFPPHNELGGQVVAWRQR